MQEIRYRRALPRTSWPHRAWRRRGPRHVDAYTQAERLLRQAASPPPSRSQVLGHRGGQPVVVGHASSSTSGGGLSTPGEVAGSLQDHEHARGALFDGDQRTAAAAGA